MATISPNDHAPAEEVKYILPTATFELGPGGSYDTDDRRVASDAEAHPWLQVEYPELPEFSVERLSKTVPYEDDYLSAPNSRAFDPEAVEKDVVEETAPVAVEAGLDQAEAVEVGDVAVTLAAADAAEPTPDAPKKGSKKKED